MSTLMHLISGLGNTTGRDAGKAPVWMLGPRWLGASEGRRAIPAGTEVPKAAGLVQMPCMVHSQVWVNVVNVVSELTFRPDDDRLEMPRSRSFLP